MSFLAPLYALGALSIGLPILFHLIRRRPKAQAEFSSLMFLTQSPPRLTKRSRLDQWPLLLLRALAILLIALAFARPFLRSLAQLQSQTPARRLVLLLDTSASMQREDLWEQAKSHCRSIINDLGTRDQIALMTFDRTLHAIVPFESDGKTTAAAQTQRVQAALDELLVSNAGSNLGAALVATADRLHNETQQVGDEQPSPAQIVLVSDLQEGCDLSALQQYQWPEEVTVSALLVETQEPGNLSAIVLPQTSEASGEGTPQLRVRFHNTSDSQNEQFMFFWNQTETDGDQGERDERDFVTQIPAGESRVVRVDIEGQNAKSLMFVGDNQPFDNEVYVALPTPEEEIVLFVGDQPTDKKQSMLYYMQQAVLGNAWRDVSVQRVETDDLSGRIADSRIPLIVIASRVSAPVVADLKQYLQDGGHVLFAIGRSEEPYAGLEVTLRELADAARITISEADVADYAMWSRIDFTHPLFLPFADPKYNDFTKIRFWAHRSIETDPADGWATVAEFDDKTPALLEKQLGRGRLWVLAAGWQPQESQLALSTKFVPLLSSMVDANLGESELRSSYEIGQDGELPIPVPVQLALPDGSLRAFDQPVPLRELELPGVYRVVDQGMQSSFAMNIPASESRTVAMAVDRLEQYGVQTDRLESSEEIAASQRQMRDMELEGRQRLWQWLIFAAMAVLAVETWLGGFLSRQAAVAQTG